MYYYTLSIEINTFMKHLLDNIDFIDHILICVQNKSDHLK